jgi:hypothetical protein
MYRSPVWETATSASHPFVLQSSDVASTTIEFLEELASARASRPFAHARCAPPTTAIHTLEISCTRVRSFPTRSRLDCRASTRRSVPVEVLRLCTDTIEEPSVSRRQARFSEPVQPVRNYSFLVIRCEPTSDAPVAFVPRSASRFCFPEISVRTGSLGQACVYRLP